MTTNPYEPPKGKPRLSEGDRESIRHAVQNWPDWVTIRPELRGDVFDIYPETKDTVLVRTGVRRGPRDGRGQVFRVEKVHGVWTAKLVGYWRS